MEKPNEQIEHFRGAEDARVTLVQYGDFECPSCKDMYLVLRRVQNTLGSRLKIIFRHFPLTDQHAMAMEAALAAEAAEAQKDGMFWQVHDHIYQRQEQLTKDFLKDIVSKLSLDVKRFEKDVEEKNYKAKVDRDIELGLSEGVDGTPTFFINGELYNEPLEYENLLREIAKAGEFEDVLKSVEKESPKLRATIDRSERGAPAAGKAIRDRFSSDEIFQRIMASADEEIDRKPRMLFFSGLAAGLIIGASFFARTIMTTAYPDDPVGLGNLLYPIGFVAIVLGGYQLFTENTLTPVTLVLTRLASIPSLLRLWGIVLFANISGAAAGAYLFSVTEIFNEESVKTAIHLGEHALSYSSYTLFSKAIVAGGLVATMVWLVHAARDTISRFFIIFMTMFLIPAGELFHCVVGAFEIFYLVFKGIENLGSVMINFFFPVVFGNTIGGVIFVAFVNYGMTSEREIPTYDFREKLSIKQWLFGKGKAIED